MMVGEVCFVRHTGWNRTVKSEFIIVVVNPNEFPGTSRYTKGEHEALGDGVVKVTPNNFRFALLVPESFIIISSSSVPLTFQLSACLNGIPQSLCQDTFINFSSSNILAVLPGGACRDNDVVVRADSRINLITFRIGGGTKLIKKRTPFTRTT